MFTGATTQTGEPLAHRCGPALGLSVEQLRLYVRDDLRIEVYLTQRFGAFYPADPRRDRPLPTCAPTARIAVLPSPLRDHPREGSSTSSLVSRAMLPREHCASHLRKDPVDPGLVLFVETFVEGARRDERESGRRPYQRRQTALDQR